MIRNVPETGASTSFVDLSLSMAKSGSPSTTAPPSATSHSLSNPSFIEKPSLGMRISTAMIDPFLSHHCSHCRLDCFGGRRKGSFERRRSEEHKSELQSLMRNSYAVFCS